jgi:YbbR domain-containing protein
MPRFLFAHWELKLIALLVAFTLWFFVATSEQAQVALASPVEYSGLDPSLVLVGGQREAVDIEIRAVRSVVARLGPETVRVRLDLAGLQAGESVVDVTPSDVQAPPGATVRRITPARLYLVAAAASTRTVNVVPQVRGVPASGFAIQRVQVEPSAVTIKGPKSTIEARAEVSTLPVDVSGTRRSVNQIVGLMLPASTYTTREQTVRVTVDLVEERMSQPQPPASRDAGRGPGR